MKTTTRLKIILVLCLFSTTIAAQKKEIKFGKITAEDFTINSSVVDSNTYTYKDGSVQMVRIFERNNGRFPASSYDSLVDFYNAMYKADNARMVFVKQGE